jgi:hypothetical protein
MRCLFCKIRNKKNSVKCQFCEYYLESSREIREGIACLENVFAKINGEIDDLEEKVHIVIGLIFRRHKYTVEDLLDSKQMDRIKSLAEKIKDDVNRWESAGKFPYRLKMFYNENAESVQDRLRIINHTIQERKPTLWERVGGFFRRLYRAVVELLPTLFQRLLTGRKQQYFEKAA